MAGARGFTLLELLVAVALLAVIGAMAYGGLDSVMASRTAIEERLAAIAELQTAVGLLERDLAMAAPRAVRDGLGGRESAMMSRPVAARRLSLTRGGPRQPPGVERSSLQRVDYGVVGETLVRTHWRHLDRTPGAVPLATELLGGMERLTFRFLDPRGEWYGDWPPPGEEGVSERLPAAVEVRLYHERWGGLQRVVVVAP